MRHWSPCRRRCVILQQLCSNSSVVTLWVGMSRPSCNSRRPRAGSQADISSLQALVHTTSSSISPSDLAPAVSTALQPLLERAARLVGSTLPTRVVSATTIPATSGASGTISASCPLHVSRSDTPIGLRCSQRQIWTKPSDVTSRSHSHWPNGVQCVHSRRLVRWRNLVYYNSLWKTVALYTFSSQWSLIMPRQPMVVGREPIHFARANSIGAKLGRPIG